MQQVRHVAVLHRSSIIVDIGSQAQRQIAFAAEYVRESLSLLYLRNGAV